MSEQEQHEQERAAEDAPVDSAQTTPHALWLMCVLGLLVALAAAAASGWLWWDRQTLEQQLGQFEADTLSQAQFREHHQDMAPRLEALEGDWRDAREMLQALRPMVGEGRGAWLRAEVLWLLSMADRNLALDGDQELSMDALRLADERLRDLGDPELLAVREALADDMAELEAMAWPDIDGMALRLASLGRQSEQWSLRRPEHPEARLNLPDASPEVDMAEDEPTWQRLLENLTEVARGLVVVRRHDEPLAPLLPPEQAYFKRLNAALQLDALRIALLRRNARLFESQLEQTRDWLHTHFDSSDEAVAAALETLEQWQDVDIDPPRPELTRALQRLQRIHAGEAGDGDEAPETDS